MGAAEREVVRAELKALLEGAGDQALTTLRADVLSMQRGFCALASSRSLELCANFRSLEQQRRRKKQQQQQKQKQQQKQRSQQKQRGRQQPQPQARRRSNQKVRPWLVGRAARPVWRRCGRLGAPPRERRASVEASTGVDGLGRPRMRRRLYGLGRAPADRPRALSL